MKTSRLIIVVLLFALSCAQPVQHPSTTTGGERPDVASPRQIERPWMSLAEWHRRVHAQKNSPERANARIVFLGDSITEGWGQSIAFKKAFADTPTLNLGIGGDQTQHLLWRIEQGALAGLKPRWIVLMVGVNNLAEDCSPSDTSKGVAEILRRVREVLPDTRVALLAILPARPLPSESLRLDISATNRLLAQQAVPGEVWFWNLEREFLGPDGTLPAEKMPDFLHPSEVGYALMTARIVELLEAAAPPANE